MQAGDTRHLGQAPNKLFTMEGETRSRILLLYYTTEHGWVSKGGVEDAT